MSNVTYPNFIQPKEISQRNITVNLKVGIDVTKASRQNTFLLVEGVKIITKNT